MRVLGKKNSREKRNKQRKRMIKRRLIFKVLLPSQAKKYIEKTF